MVKLEIPMGLPLALTRLQEVVFDLSSKHKELASLTAAEHAGKIQAWFGSDVSTLKERDQLAAFHAVDLTVDIIRLKGEIKSLEEERDFLNTFLQLV